MVFRTSTADWEQALCKEVETGEDLEKGRGARDTRETHEYVQMCRLTPRQKHILSLSAS